MHLARIDLTPIQTNVIYLHFDCIKLLFGGRFFILLCIEFAFTGCGNVNWCWRATCNKCNTAKPASLVTVDEVRDGRGGGFNERFVVHYGWFTVR